MSRIEGEKRKQHRKEKLEMLTSCIEILTLKQWK